MSGGTIGDGAADGAPAPDAHGGAALLLVESLLHDLVARRTLPLDAAIEIVRTAIDAQREIADERGGDPARPSPEARLLTAIRDSLAIDASADRPAPDGRALPDGVA